jgi:cyanophycinase
MKFKGTLIPIGGNEDKGHVEPEGFFVDFIEEGILSHVVKESGGIDAKIVIIPTASSIPIEVGENYLIAFAKLGCKNLTVLDIRNKGDVENSDYIEDIRTADCIMFSGGNQSRISKIIGGSRMHNIMKDRIQNENIVIAGTSAGAMAMSKEMIIGGSSSEALLKGAVGMSNGLGLIPQLIIDSHFIRRGRFGRLAEAVAKFPSLIGIGLAEDTGLIIKNCNEFRIIGSGMVILFDPSKLAHNNEQILEVGTPMSMSNLVVHILSNGDRFMMDERTIEVLPVEAVFE